ncbi:MAG: dephospho-CoA kinase, partial [Rhodobacter sp.]
LLDIPLLFETGADASVDASLVVTAPPALQRARVMARPGMTEALFQTLLAKQLPDRDKRARATHLIETLSLPSVRACVQALIRYIRETHHA